MLLSTHSNVEEMPDMHPSSLMPLEQALIAAFTFHLAIKDRPGKKWMLAMGFSIIHSFVVAKKFFWREAERNNWWFENLERCGNRKVFSIASMCSKWKHSKILLHISPMERERTAIPSSFQPSLFCYFPCFWIPNHLRNPWYQPSWIIRVAVIMLGTISSVPISRRWKKTGTRWNHSKEPQWSQQ